MTEFRTAEEVRDWIARQKGWPAAPSSIPASTSAASAYLNPSPSSQRPQSHSAVDLSLPSYSSTGAPTPSTQAHPTPSSSIEDQSQRPLRRHSSSLPSYSVTAHPPTYAEAYAEHRTAKAKAAQAALPAIQPPQKESWLRRHFGYHGPEKDEPKPKQKPIWMDPTVPMEVRSKAYDKWYQEGKKHQNIYSGKGWGKLA